MKKKKKAPANKKKAPAKKKKAAPAKKKAAPAKKKAAPAKKKAAPAKKKAAPAKKKPASAKKQAPAQKTLKHEPVAAVAFSRDGTRMALSLVRGLSDRTGGGHVAIYDVTGDAPRLLREVSLPGGVIEILALSPSGSFLAAGQRYENGVQLVDARTGAIAHTLIVKGATSLAFAPDGQRLAVGSYNDDEAAGRVVVLDAKGGAELFRSPPYRQGVVGLSFLPDGLVLVGALDHWGAAIAWDVDARRELFRLPEFDEPPARRGRAVAGSADGLSYATCDGMRVDVWSIDGQDKKATLDVGCVPQTLALNRDGSILFVGSPAPAAWSVGSGARLSSLDGPGIVAVHPDNERMLVVSSVDPRIGPPLVRIRDALFPTHTIE